MTTKLFLRCVCLIALLAIVAAAQDVGPGSSWRKRVITYNGILKYDTGMPRVGAVGLTLSLYAEQEGGDPLWRESQTVQTDEQGRYTVLLGATEEEGLPLEFFTSGRAQWLGLQVQGEEEQARVLLVTVPYALKAADADTVGGKPLSSFVLYEDLEKAASKNIPVATIVMQNGTSLAHSGVPGTGETASSNKRQGAEKLQLSGGITPVAYNETGSNTLFGEGAGASTTTGIQNSFFGYNAGTLNNGPAPNQASNNSFFGWGAGQSNTTGAANSYFGSQAGASQTQGSLNSFFGFRAGYSDVSGGTNSFFGGNAGYSNTTGGDSFFGRNAGYSNTTGGGNSFFGHAAGYSNTTGGHNSFFGSMAGNFNTTGGYNAFFGYYAGFSNTTGYSNNFFGNNTGYDNTTGYFNSFFGNAAGTYNTTGYENSFFGSAAGSGNTEGSLNSFFGSMAGWSNTTGSLNSFFGHYSGYFNKTGGSNSFFGWGAGSYSTTGGNNSSFGRSAGTSNTTEDNNSFIGAYSNGIPGITNATAVGYKATVTQSNSLVLGSISGVNGSFADTKVGIGTTSPDRKLQIASTPGMNAELHIGGAGDEAKDVFSGMGVDPSAGPAFNFGYAGYSFGRSAGFLNVRPDASATPPNPSLRFMTANQQRMIITNTGNVGIGTTAPKTGLQADNGDIYIGSAGQGIILKSPDGLACARLTLSNAGALVSTPLACP